MKTTQHQQMAEDLLAQIANGTFAVADRYAITMVLCAASPMSCQAGAA
jgi:hypothetical protein